MGHSLYVCKRNFAVIAVDHLQADIFPTTNHPHDFVNILAGAGGNGTMNLRTNHPGNVKISIWIIQVVGTGFEMAGEVA